MFLKGCGKMKICICDDELYIHDEIKELLKSFTSAETQFKITGFTSGEELVKSYSSNQKFDIIFIDVEMNEINGIQAAEKIREIDPKAIIIFVSNYPNYVFDVFKLEALHFIVKPIKPTEFENVFGRALNKYQLMNSSITLQNKNDRITIKIDDIIYIEGYNRHVTVHTKTEEFRVPGKITDVYEEIEPHGFVRVHQGFIVNMAYIKLFGKDDVIMSDDSKVMMSVRKRSNALEAYDNYIQRRKW